MKVRGALHRWWMRMLFSVRGRATVIAVGVAAVVLSLCAILVVILVRNELRGDVGAAAARTARKVAFEVPRGPLRTPITTAPGDTDLVQIVGADGQVLAATLIMNGRPALASVWPQPPETRADARVCPPYMDRCVHVTGFGLAAPVRGQRAIVYAAEPEPAVLSGWALPVAAVVVMVLLLLLIWAGTWSTIGLAFAPVEAIRRELADINAKELDRRVPVPEAGGEVQDLAETVNGALARLENAQARERRFVSDASHDLRNPIAGMRATLELALDEPDPRPLIETALRDTERLNDIVVDLLELARLDAGAAAPVREIDLAELVTSETAHRPFQVALLLDLEAGAVVVANRLRLSRVLNNLLANAERHARTTVWVTVRREEGEAVLEVRDDGDGIPCEHRERVFERFARLDESRRKDPHGTGLGLPIAREIARMYGGTLAAEDGRGGGARLVLRLPA
ncbi:HAMP domain-containing histidine kinase [Nonomuraea sp. NBC_01738]|uniref:sensor histidine kinase n=1 Tax=Nonomuraea sp. NBC_01738 TaxID=2976003 RepID=UPI002E11F13A|nr:HAMP domain-containing histidine kinase [Nonomuraea sp. NBC_01738]